VCSLLASFTIYCALCCAHHTVGLTLSNFTLAQAHLQAVVSAPAADCQPSGGNVIDFVLPFNGTRVIEAPAVADVCWRQQLPAQPASAGPQQWSAWNRAHIVPGRLIDTAL
jgi:hypothetical protein